MLPRVRRRRQAALVGSHVSALAVAFALLSDSTDFLDLRELFFEVLVFSQVGLLTVWAVLGRTQWFVRVPTLLVCTCLYWVLLCRGPAEVDWAVALAIYVGCTTILLVLIRAGGVGLAFHDTLPVALEAQFTMWHLLAWTAAAAALFGLLRLLRYDRFWTVLRLGFLDSNIITAFATEVCCYSLLIVLGTAMLLTEGRLVWRLATLAVVAPLLGAIAWFVWTLHDMRDPRQLAAHLTANILLVLISGISLGVVRSCGYRLTRPLYFSRRAV